MWFENKRHFFKLSNINLISNFKQNLIEDYYQQNKFFNSNTCCKRIEESKVDFTKKRVKDIIKHKGCQKSTRMKKMLKMPVYLKTYIIFTTQKPFLFIFNITDKSIIFIYRQKY